MLIDDGLFDGQLMHTQVQGDGTRLPYPDNTFDKIIASEVLEHIPDDVAAYDEFFRILKPGGMLAATVPATFPEKICWKLSDEYYAPKAEGGHVRIYTENEVRSKLEGAGFDPGLSYKAHALHAVLVDPVRRRREQRGRRQLDREAVPQAARVGHRLAAVDHPNNRETPQPVAGQESRRPGHKVTAPHREAVADPRSRRCQHLTSPA